jgi:hypothetical protein
MRRIVVPLVAALAVTLAVPMAAQASHDTGGAKSYKISNGKVKKLTKSRALSMLLFDLGQRAGGEMTEAQDATCKVRKRKATCSYRTQSTLSASFGLDGAYCVTDGKIKLARSGKRFTATQAAEDC